jgi:large subunit ribosomal protein L5e
MEADDFGGEYYEGEFAMDEDDSGKKPFYALLDVGLNRTTTGARIWGAVKGACDGGLEIPHSYKRFPGTTVDDEGEMTSNNEVLRKYIFGGHVADYMRKLEEENKEKYNAHFSKYIAAGIGADDVEGQYKAVHAAIRADPNKKRDAKELGRFKTLVGARSTERKSFKVARQSREDKADKIRQKLLAMGKKSVSAMEWKEGDEAAAEVKEEAAPIEEEDDEDDDLL